MNGRRWSPEILRAAIKAAASEKSGPTTLLVENNEFFGTCKVEYHEGEKYPQLQRDASKPDLLSQILKPHAQAQVSP